MPHALWRRRRRRPVVLLRCGIWGAWLCNPAAAESRVCAAVSSLAASVSPPVACGNEDFRVGSSELENVSTHSANVEVDAEFFWRHGFLHIREFVDNAEVAGLRAALSTLLDAWEPPTGLSATASLSLRSSNEQNSSQQVDHTFMLESATQASFFLEKGALDLERGVLRQGVSKRRAVRKVGHALHLAPGAFQDFVRSPKVARLAAALGWRSAAIAQTQYRIVPGTAAGVDRHQDSTALYTEPPSVLALWLALEDADQANGCLQVRLGSHVEPIRERLVRRACEACAGGSVQLAFERLQHAEGSIETPRGDDTFTALEVAKGDLIVMHGALEHLSVPGDFPDRSRESLQVHLVDTNARWPPDNWLQYPAGEQFMPLWPTQFTPWRRSSPRPGEV